MQRARIATLSLAALLAAAGCGTSRESGPAPATVTVPAGGATGGSVTLVVGACTPCHGDPGRATAGADALVQAAPPRAPTGNPADPVIGAHLAHLTDGPLARAVACASCHIVPSGPGAHQAPTVFFSGLATSGGAAPTFTPTTLTCSSTYCHGAFPGGASASPVWGGPAAQCGSCHTIPPPQVAQGGSHPDIAPGTCARCHPGYTATSVDVDLHVNGAVDVAFTCTSCHGDPTRTGTDAGNPAQPLAPAPPTDSKGQANSAAVGAHLRHLLPPDPSGAGGPRFSHPVACAECHTIPDAPPTGGADTHGNGTADVAFGPLSKTILLAQGDTRPPFTPTWDGTSCSTTYCHGNFKNGNAGNQPITWTSTGTALCGSCHGFPPGGTHPVRTDCATCHPLPGGLPDPTRHVNGEVNFGP